MEDDGYWYGPASPSGASGESSSPPRRRRIRSPRSEEAEGRSGEVEGEADAAERLARRLSFEAQRRWLHDATMGCISGPASPSETSPQARRRLASSLERQIESIGHPGAVDTASRELLDPALATRAPADLAP